jgi:hypothetical protein
VRRYGSPESGTGYSVNDHVWSALMPESDGNGPTAANFCLAPIPTTSKSAAANPSPPGRGIRTAFFHWVYSAPSESGVRLRGRCSAAQPRQEPVLAFSRRLHAV